MVATQAVTTAALAVVTSRLATRAPRVSQDPRIDAAIKALVGVGLVLVATRVDGWGKTILVGAGVGVAAAALAPFVPGL